MQILLSNSSGEPLYSQIVTQVRRMIRGRELHEGDPLPSMRQLAKDLRISLITTKRAYEELERLGLLVTVGGKGCFVGAASPQRLCEEHRLELQKHLQAAAVAAVEGGIDRAEFLETAALLYSQQETF